MKEVKCAFCKGTGDHPHFRGTCPVCKGRGENQIRGKVTSCRDCRGSGQKGGTTLTCFTCGGLGVVPDTREVIKKARAEIRKKPSVLPTEEAEDEPEEDEKESCFCQSCAKKINRESTLKVCLECFRKMKKE